MVHMAINYPRSCMTNEGAFVFQLALCALKILPEVSKDWDDTNARDHFWDYSNQQRHKHYLNTHEQKVTQHFIEHKIYIQVSKAMHKGI